FSRRRRHTRSKRDWSSDVCSSDLTTMDPALNCSSTISLAVMTEDKSGVLSSVIGVGTAMMNHLHDPSEYTLSVNVIVESANRLFPASWVTSVPFLYVAILSLLISNPTTEYFSASSTASGKPT